MTGRRRGAPRHDKTIAGLSSTFAPAYAGSPTRAPSHPRPTWVSTFQSGHGFTDSLGGATITNDTTDYLYGSQSVRVTNSGNGVIQKGSLALDLTGKALTLLLRVNTVPAGATVVVYAAESTALSKYRSWIIYRGTDSSRRWNAGEWVQVTLPWESGTDVGTPTRSLIAAVRIRVLSGDGDFNIQAVGTVPVPTRTATVSFTFDDGYTSVLDAANILASRGIRGTAYVIPDLAGTSGFMTAAQMRTLQDVYGWDIESHGQDVYTGMTAAQMRAEWVRTRKWFADNGLGRGEHLAYPGGQNNATVAATAREFFTTARTIGAGDTPQVWPPELPYQMRGYSSIAGVGGPSVATVQAAIDKAVLGGHHITLAFHRITAGASTSAMECSQADLATLADYCRTVGADTPTIADLFR